MNRIKSFEKHLGDNVSHDIYLLHNSSSYYSHHRGKKGNDNGTSCSSVDHKVYPLTLENLSKVGIAEPSNMPLARYWNELSQMSGYHESNLSSQRKAPRHRQQQQDRVLESPRLLPFPYHNDSQFLPTAEHDYPGGCSTTDASSSLISLSVHTVGSRQRLSNQSSLTFSNRAYHRQLFTPPPRGQHKTHSYVHSHDNNSITSSFISQKQTASSVSLASPSTLHQDTEVSQKKRRSSNSRFAIQFKRKLHRFRSNSSTILEKSSCNTTYHSPSSSVIWTTILDENQSAQLAQPRKGAAATAASNTSWLDKLWKLFRPSLKSFTRRKCQNNATNACSTVGEKPVWYSQFRCNPPPPSGTITVS
ncbi:hypothetical protein BD408DRAFT_409648 [Parasitella parasitica]|nr:hypothetical protein BD408DRAFT_409648 [Parasitella parasitica]